ncbi:MAG: hypothetical protein ACH34U_11325 [Cyanobium sp.]|jgi:hypothetical protein
MSPTRSAPEWLTLTEIGRVYGISAVHTGKLLETAGLRQRDGRPSPEALRNGLALRRHSSPSGPTLWNRQMCAPHLEQQGLQPRGQRQLVDLWAELLSALQQGSAAVAISPEDMAEEIPADLVAPVNLKLQEQGCAFQVHKSLKRKPHGPAGLPSPASDATGSHRRG